MPCSNGSSTAPSRCRAAELGAREVVGNLFGLASAILGMRRLVWAWPVGPGRQRAALHRLRDRRALRPHRSEPLWGQAGRQVVLRRRESVYGWWRWSQVRRAGGASDGGAIAPRWATRCRAASQLLVLGVVGYAAAYAVLTQVLGSWGPTTEAWILAGSMLATYGMARGWVEFWLVWIVVDVVGVTTLVRAGYYPTAGCTSSTPSSCVDRLRRLAARRAGAVVDASRGREDREAISA